MKLFSFYFISIILSVVLIGITSVAAIAQGSTRPKPSPDLEKPESLENIKLITKDSGKSMQPFATGTSQVTSARNKPSFNSAKPTNITNGEFQSDTGVVNAYNHAVKAYYYALERKNRSAASTIDSLSSYDNWALENRKALIKRQQTIASLIFVLVVIVVLSGLIFSALQFRIALKGMKRRGVTPDTSLKASLNGIEISSSILGVIILTLSLIFFYLYLRMVYPIVILGETSN